MYPGQTPDSDVVFLRTDTSLSGTSSEHGLVVFPQTTGKPIGVLKFSQPPTHLSLEEPFVNDDHGLEQIVVFFVTLIHLFSHVDQMTFDALRTTVDGFIV